MYQGYDEHEYKNPRRGCKISLNVGVVPVERD